MRRVRFFMHDLGEAELAGIAAVFSGPVLTTGETVERFERRFADALQCRHALGLTSCTGALHLSLLALGIGPGDEVLTTPMTFIATATAIIAAGAEPVFVDVEADTGLIDPGRIEAAITSRTRAIMPVHLYGQMCDMREIRQLADRHGLKVIEDAAHCLEGDRDGIRPGQLADTACFSFYATKAITSGEGGAVITNSDELTSRLRLLRLHGMTKTAADRHREGYKHWDMTVLGWKYNMDNIQAAILLPQLERMHANCAHRKSLCERYEKLFADVPEVRIPKQAGSGVHARHLFPIWIEPELRDRVIEQLLAQGIEVAVNYRAIHLLTYFREKYAFNPGAFPNAEMIGNSTISLPMYASMPEEDVDYVVHVVRQILGTA